MCSGLNRITEGMPRVINSPTSARSESSECWTTPGSDPMGWGSVTPSRTNSGAMRSSGVSTVSATIRRRAGVRRAAGVGAGGTRQQPRDRPRPPAVGPGCQPAATSVLAATIFPRSPASPRPAPTRCVVGSREIGVDGDGAVHRHRGRGPPAAPRSGRGPNPPAPPRHVGPRRDPGKPAGRRRGRAWSTG